MIFGDVGRESCTLLGASNLSLATGVVVINSTQFVTRTRSTGWADCGCAWYSYGYSKAFGLSTLRLCMANDSLFLVFDAKRFLCLRRRNGGANLLYAFDRCYSIQYTQT